MSNPHLRVFSPDDDHFDEQHDHEKLEAFLAQQASAADAVLDESQFAPSTPKRVRVQLREMVPLLLDAAITNRSWLEDFADDTADIPQDLYEVLLAYRTIATEKRRAA